MHISNVDDVRQRREGWKKAFEAGDANAIMSFYAPGSRTVAFDILPPLQYAGWAAYRADWINFLATFDGPLKVETKDVQISAVDGLAIVHGLVRLVGSIKERPFDVWLRATNALQKIDGEWLVTHDHVSVPVDITTGIACMDLTP